MSKRVLVLVEGQTEERFVKDVLGPAFEAQGLYLRPTILTTSRLKDGTRFKGGVTSFVRFESDVKRLLWSPGGALVTTMVDYYGLPSDFPGTGSLPVQGGPVARVEHVESALFCHFGSSPTFLPFLLLHEFEALVFASPTELLKVIPTADKQAEFSSICAGFQTPEEINDRPEFAPSKRLRSLFPRYRKTLHGPTTVARIGLTRIRQQCPHFNGWMQRLEAFAAS